MFSAAAFWWSCRHCFVDWLVDVGWLISWLVSLEVWYWKWLWKLVATNDDFELFSPVLNGDSYQRRASVAKKHKTGDWSWFLELLTFYYFFFISKPTRLKHSAAFWTQSNAVDGQRLRGIIRFRLSSSKPGKRALVTVSDFFWMQRKKHKKIEH